PRAFPYTTLFRSDVRGHRDVVAADILDQVVPVADRREVGPGEVVGHRVDDVGPRADPEDRHDDRVAGARAPGVESLDEEIVVLAERAAHRVPHDAARRGRRWRRGRGDCEGRAGGTGRSEGRRGGEGGGGGGG